MSPLPFLFNQSPFCPSIDVIANVFNWFRNVRFRDIPNNSHLDCPWLFSFKLSFLIESFNSVIDCTKLPNDPFIIWLYFALFRDFLLPLNGTLKKKTNRKSKWSETERPNQKWSKIKIENFWIMRQPMSCFPRPWSPSVRILS